MAESFFKSDEHRKRFVEVMQRIGKIYDGNKFDAEYSAALFILAADKGTWQATQDYVSSTGIRFEDMLKELHFSGGEGVLIRLAANLFFSSYTFGLTCEDDGTVNGDDTLIIAPVEIPARLDGANFELALQAMRIRRGELSISNIGQG